MLECRKRPVMPVRMPALPANAYRGAPRPPMTDVGTESAFRLEKAQAFPKKETSLEVRGQLMRSSPASIYIVLVSRSINMLSVTDFVPKGIISGVRVQAGLHLDMLDADRSPNMQSAFLPELHRWISKLIARHLHACLPLPGDLLITMVKEMVIFYKKRVSKNEKKSYLSLIWKRWKRDMTARLPVTVSSVQTWIYM